MKITREWLEKHDACNGGRVWFAYQTKTDAIEIVEALLNDKRPRWVCWVLPRLFDRKRLLMYSIFAAEQVLSVYEKAASADNEPREAIEAARLCVEDDNDKNQMEAFRIYIAIRVRYPTYDNRDERDYADYAALAACYTAGVAAYNYNIDAYIAAENAIAADEAVLIKIANYGFKLLQEQEREHHETEIRD